MKHCLMPRGKFVILERLEIPDDAVEVSVKKQLSWLSLLHNLMKIWYEKLRPKLHTKKQVYSF